MYLIHPSTLAAGYLHRRVRPIPSGPADVLRRDRVRRASVAAADAPKPVSVRTVPSVDHSALRTPPTRPPRVHERAGDALLPRFVLDERPELSERPGIQFTTLRPARFYPLPDAFEVLERNAGESAPGLRDHVLGDRMIYVRSEAALLDPARPKEPLRRLRTFLLQFPAQPRMPSAQGPEVLPRKWMPVLRIGLPIRIYGQMDDSKIDAQVIARWPRCRLSNVKDLPDEEFARPK